MSAVTNYRSNIDLPAAADLIRRAGDPVVVLTHAKPDGDAFGSVVAVAAALRALGRSVRAFLAPPISANLLELPGRELVESYGEKSNAGQHTPNEQPLTDAAPLATDPALVVLLDTGAWSQVGPLGPLVESRLDRTLILDHHLSGDVAAAHRFIDPAAASTTQIVADLLDLLLGAETWTTALSPSVAHERSSCVIPAALFTGIASDTGWFRFSNTTARTHELAARLLRQGVDHAEIYRILEENERPQKLLLLGRALAGLEMIHEDAAALMTLRREDFEQSGALEQETERLINVPQQVGSVRVVALVTEKLGEGGESVASLSFRSKPPRPDADPADPAAINVAELAADFGGGGHARAAGARVQAPLDEVLPRVREALRKALRR